MNQDLPLQQLKKYWGYESFRPLQRESIDSVLAGQDSVVVLPTGGGKSICYQVPALCDGDGLAVVVSPLISLMKDQVDGLVASGIPAASLNSMLGNEEKSRVIDQVRRKTLRLLYVSPERLVQSATIELLQKSGVRYFAIDEAHCISSWGHDFRPEYRQLSTLKEKFRGASVHAFTATATPRVRADIAEQLQLTSAETLVGSFYRPNLRYTALRRADAVDQMRQIIDRYRDQSGIIYCNSRKDVESVAATFSELGYRAKPYHAGMSDADRNRNQEEFINEKIDIMVATVAFGMGIDKSSVRYVIHYGMPKSLEAYQQESGRAGRDGLRSECCLLFSGADLMLWKRLSDEQPGSKSLLEAMYRYCTRTVCRHRQLVEYFGQAFELKDCQACDICLGDRELVSEPLTLAQKIISCVLRVEQRFGAQYVASILTGSQAQRVVELGHDKLSTHNLLSDHDKREVADWIEQLVDQGYLEKSGEYNVIKMTATGRQVLRGEVTPRLLQPHVVAKRNGAMEVKELSEVEQGLFDELRQYRRELAGEKNIPPFVIFHDGSLRDMARVRPSQLTAMGAIPGVGEKKLEDYGAGFVERIVEFCQQKQLDVDCDVASMTAAGRPKPKTKLKNMAKQKAFELFAQGETVERVAGMIGRAASTTSGYLGEYIQLNSITDPAPWVDSETASSIREAAATVGSLDKLAPVRELLGEDYSFEQIRVVIECLRVETDYCASR